ncbi:MAG: Ig-like domain-containing protein [Flavobacteriaceae bacterium]
MKTNKLLTIFSFVMIALFAGCEKDDYQETIGICPLVVSTDPTDGDINVPLDKVITVTFNEEMNPATLTMGSITIEGQSEITGTISYDQSTLTASFTPSELLSSSTTYVGKVKTSVKDVDGNALQEDYVWTFSTGENIAPMVISTDPEDNETDVVLNKVITATFNQPMDPLTVNGTTFTVMNGGTAVAGTITYSGTTASFTPAAELDLSTVYTATITTETENTTGIALQSDYI